MPTAAHILPALSPEWHPFASRAEEFQAVASYDEAESHELRFIARLTPDELAAVAAIGGYEAVAVGHEFTFTRRARL